MSISAKVNPDLAKERANATVDIERLQLYIGEQIYFSEANYRKMLLIREKLVKSIKPLFEENFYNLDRDQKYSMVLKKSLELIDFVQTNNCEDVISLYTVGAVLGIEKILFNLHFTMFKDAVEVWGTPEQSAHWKTLMERETVFGTYVQTEIGHGTYLRGLETTATYDKATQQFVIDTPTLTAIKFWPGASGKTCNYAIVMAKLIVEGREHGIHAFVVQLRSLENHRVMPGLETGDIGRKFGFDATDNGYLRFSGLRVPRTNMLMQFARVTADGRFEREPGSELLMYAAMLLMRGTLSMLGSFFLSISTTIAVRYSCVRRQTTNAEGVELQIIDYQTQQYRLFPALAATFAFSFAGWTFRSMLMSIQKEANNFKNVSAANLAKLHAVSSSLKAVVFGDCLRYAQSNRLCCGGHGYSASSGLSQIIQEADAGCTYEGDNVVLLLQCGRYLLKCAQRGDSAHLQLNDVERVRAAPLYQRFARYFELLAALFDESMNEITNKLFNLVKEQGVAELTAWNQSSQQLISVARVYADLFIVHANMTHVLGLSANTPHVPANQTALADLLELYFLYAICEVYGADLLRFNLVEPATMSTHRDQLLALLPLIRVNAVALVDSFNMLDSNLCSSLGAYDGNAYERLFDFAQKSQMNEKEVHDSYHKYLRPYAIRHKHNARL